MRPRALFVLGLVLACKRATPGASPPPMAPGIHAGAVAHSADGAVGPAVPPPAGSIDPPALSGSFHEAGQYLPQGLVADGWTQSGPVRYFTDQTIFQEIDGEGEVYVAYGFRQLAKTDYRKVGSDLAVTAEVYDMGSSLGAYGRYSLVLSDSRDPAAMESRSVPLGVGGFLGTSQLVFWKGQYLVQLNLEDEGGGRDEAALAPLAREILLPLGSRVAGSLPGDVTAPSGPAALPTEGLVWGGRTYLPTSALEVDRTGPAWVGHYRTASQQRYRIAVLVRATPQEAHSTAGIFRTGTATALAAIGDEAFTVTGGHGELMVARKGNTVVVVADPAVTGLTALPREGKLERLRAVVAGLP